MLGAGSLLGRRLTSLCPHPDGAPQVSLPSVPAQSLSAVLPCPGGPPPTPPGLCTCAPQGRLELMGSLPARLAFFGGIGVLRNFMFSLVLIPRIWLQGRSGEFCVLHQKTDVALLRVGGGVGGNLTAGPCQPALGGSNGRTGTGARGARPTGQTRAAEE